MLSVNLVKNKMIAMTELFEKHVLGMRSTWVSTVGDHSLGYCCLLMTRITGNLRRKRNYKAVLVSIKYRSHKCCSCMYLGFITNYVFISCYSRAIYFIGSVNIKNLFIIY